MNWDKYLLDLAIAVSAKSKDRSTKIGAVIVGPENEIRSTGFNGFPRDIDDNKEERHVRPAKYLWSEHAERNAIYAAAKVGVALNRCKIYISWWPCTDCARAIIQAGIKEIVIDMRDEEKNKEFNNRWKDNIQVSKEMLLEAEIKISEYSEQEKVV